MKIVFITSTSYADTVFPLINELCKNNQIHLIINFSKTTQKISFINIKGVFRKNAIIDNGDHFLKDAIKLLDDPNKVNITLIYWSSLKIIDFRNWLFVLKVRKCINDSEIVHIQTISFFWLLAIRFNKNKCLIVDYHDPFEHSGQSKSFFLKLSKKKFNKIANSIVIHNGQDKKNFEKQYKTTNNKVKILPFGVIPLNKLYGKNKNSDSNKNLVLFFGRISRYKGIEYLVEAAKLVRKTITDLKVIIAGNGKFYFDISDIKNDNTFKIINRYISNNELADLIRQSEIVVCPYVDATQSGVVMTAFAFNKPVIASAVGGFLDVVKPGKTGLLVPPKNVKALANAIIGLLKDPEKIQEMSNNISKLAAFGEFSWDNIAQKMISLYLASITT